MMISFVFIFVNESFLLHLINQSCQSLSSFLLPPLPSLTTASFAVVLVVIFLGLKSVRGLLRPNYTTNRNLNQVKEERRSRTYTFRLTHSISLTRHSLSPQLSAFGRGTTTRSCMGAPPPPNNDTRADGYSNNERLKPPRKDRCCKLNDPRGMPRDIPRYGCTSIVAEEDMLHTHAK